ncbi:MAG TPA: SidA/IucD/PvdA family monooxygenase [Pseudonocardiaceae bacterium]
MRATTDYPHYGCIGIGAGPANLSLASLLYPHTEISNLFLDRKITFDWHDGQQLPDTTLQVSILKDLVSLADPTSGFSFLSYLHARGRIYHFINAQFDAVPRREFRNYLQWAAARNENIVFGENVLSVDFDDTFVVRTDRRTVTADNLSVGVGNRPWVPPLAADLPDEHQYHVSDVITRGQDLVGRRVCVVGGGQSGAETFLDLISRSPRQRPKTVSWVTRRRNYFPIDDSPFTNDFYTPSYSDHHFGLSSAQRAEFNANQVLSSDGISESTLRQIYQRVYGLRFIDGAEDLVTLLPHREVVRVRRSDDGCEVELAAGDRVDRIDCDVIIWATGFRAAPMDFLDPIRTRLCREGNEFRIDADFAVQWDGPADHNIFVHNAAEQQRGLADRNLSLIAWRSQRIVNRLRGVRGTDQLPSFLDWAATTNAEPVAASVLP